MVQQSMILLFLFGIAATEGSLLYSSITQNTLLLESSIKENVEDLEEMMNNDLYVSGMIVNSNDTESLIMTVNSMNNLKHITITLEDIVIERDINHNPYTFTEDIDIDASGSVDAQVILELEDGEKRSMKVILPILTL